MAKKKIRRNVKHRFPGIKRTASRAVYELETQLALAQRHLRQHGKQVAHVSPIQVLYCKLTPRNRRKLYEYGELLLGTPKK